MRFMPQCPNGHSVSPRDVICKYCGAAIPKRGTAQALPRAQEELESELLTYTVEPVCGWLVCLNGAQEGQSFTLHSGKNFIGKDNSNDVVLLGDAEVEPRNHAIVAYDEMNREFMLVPGESRGMVYLDRGEGFESIFHATKIDELNMIRLGKTFLLFKPLCGRHFAWEAPDGGEVRELEEAPTKLLQE